MNIIGVDLGTSITKIVECTEKLEIIHKRILPEKNFEKAIQMFVNEYDIDFTNIKFIVATGVGVSKINIEEYKGIDIKKVDEFQAIASGRLTFIWKTIGYYHQCSEQELLL